MRTSLKSTVSRCPLCNEQLPAEVWSDERDNTVHLSRTCPKHGESTTLLSSDARFYWLSTGDPANACGCPGSLGKNAGNPKAKNDPFETLSTCLALIEIVDSCNLRCPTCYADSPFGHQEAALKYTPLPELKERITSAIGRKGSIEILQLSGGEPTLHPQFFELLRWCQDHKEIDYVLINTNGVRIANDEDFAARLAETFAYGNVQLYLQFDGIQEAGQQALRGADLRKTKQRTLERCGEIGLPVTLAMTVTQENREHLWEAVSHGLTFPHVRGISFQPEFFSGRTPRDRADLERMQSERLNTADVILGLVEQSRETLGFEDFTPLPCGDPNCATIGYLLKVGDEIKPVSDFVSFETLQGFLDDRVRYRPEDLAQCGCESEPLGELLKQFEIDESHTFRLFIKPFMDALTWDEDRIDRCCTHVIRPDGKLDSFCRYYSNHD